MELKYTIFIIFCYNLRASDGYVLDPPSGKIDIIEFDSYTFGIEDSKKLEITRCEYLADTGQSGSFEIIPKYTPPEKTSPRESKAQGPNLIQNLGDSGECKIKVSDVDDHGPKMWNMIAYRNKSTVANVVALTTKIEENEVVVANANFSITFYYSISILESRIYILEGTGIFNYLRLKDMKAVLCKLKFNDTEIQINMKSAEPIGQISTSENTSKRLSSLGENLCGFKLLKVIKEFDDNYFWSLTVTDGGGKMYRSNFELNIESARDVQNRHLTKSVFFNQKFEIDCSCRLGNIPQISFLCNSTARQLYCELYKPDGSLVETKDDKYVIERASMEHIGRWRYYIGHERSIDLLDFTVDVIAKGSKTVQVWQNETSDYLNLGCNLVSFEDRKALFCGMVAPNNRIFNLVEFGATDRYLALGTDLDAGICSLQIKKPLKAFEIGLWKCEISPKYDQMTGAFISVYSPAVPDYSKHVSMSTFINERFEIFCRVPYFSEYCYIQAPNGTLYQTMNRLDIRLGKCMYTIEKVEKSDNGTWKCFYASKTGLPDDEITVEVFIADVLQYYDRVEVDQGDTVELMCTSGRAPMKYCRFISPFGVGYQLSKDGSSDRISYHGEGLEYGECGIKILNIRSDEAGTWQCAIEIFGHDGEEAIGRINVEVVSSSFRGSNVAAIGIGTSVGVLLILSIAATIGIRKWKQRSRSTLEITNLQNNSENSTQDNGDVELYILSREHQS